jgi:hypothetical protein
MDRRTFVGVMAGGAASPVLKRVAVAQPALKVKNVVLVHGLFADGSCWSGIIPQLRRRASRLRLCRIHSPL